MRYQLCLLQVWTVIYLNNKNKRNFFFEILSDLNQAVPTCNHLADESNFLYLFLFHSLLRLTSFHSQNKNRKQKKFKEHLIHCENNMMHICQHRIKNTPQLVLYQHNKCKYERLPFACSTKWPKFILMQLVEFCPNTTNKECLTVGLESSNSYTLEHHLVDENELHQLKKKTQEHFTELEAAPNTRTLDQWHTEPTL